VVFFSFPFHSFLPVKHQGFWTCASSFGIHSLQGIRTMTFFITFLLLSSAASILLALHHNSQSSFLIHRNQTALLFPLVATLLLHSFPIHPRLLFNITTIIPQISSFACLILWMLGTKSLSGASDSHTTTLSEPPTSLNIPTEFMTKSNTKVSFYKQDINHSFIYTPFRKGSCCWSVLEWLVLSLEILCDSG
jgi:hypothetical protein